MTEKIKLPRIGYGCYALSGAYGHQLNDGEREKIINKAYNFGITYFDTAGNYGNTETILGKALINKRRDVFIAK